MSPGPSHERLTANTWQSIADSLPAVAHQAQTARITTFSASLSARLELALNIVRHADGVESASEQLYQIIGAGTSTIESVPCAIAMVELANTDPNRCAVLCANLGGDTDTIGAMATAICGALHGVSAINPQLKQTLDEVNQLDFARYAVALASLSSTAGGTMNGARLLTLLPTLHTRRPLTVIGAAVIDIIADAWTLPRRGGDIELQQTERQCRRLCAEYCRGVENDWGIDASNCAAAGPGRVGGEDSPPSGKRGIIQRD
ncbi:hydrolase [Salmonella sp. NCTC 11881]|nr:hydrolase [Salmonella sp. NCTC 11881]